MPLTRSQQAEINLLLLRREQAFTRVSQLEKMVNARLGSPYPFEPPPELPSARKGKRKPSHPTGNTSHQVSQTTPLKIPPHTGDGSVFNVHYEQDGHVNVEQHRDVRALQNLLQINGSEFKILKIEND